MAKEKAGADSIRSRFKATPLKKLQKVVDEDDVVVGGSSNEYLNLVDGKTLKIRIFPAHPGQDAFYTKRKSYWLSVNGKDGEKRRITVLDSRVHGGTKYDLIEEYVKYAKAKWGKDTAKINALVGTDMNSQSLNPSFTWLCYADVVSEDSELRAKLWEFKKMVRDALNRLSFSEDDDEPIEVDPFTDPDEGLPVLVKYLKNPNKKKGENFYDVKFPKKPEPRPLTDEELEYFANLKPLSDVLPKYDMRMFDTALEGLQNFDEENDMGLFDDDEWLDIVEKVKAQYEGGDDDSDEEEEKPKKKTAPKKKAEPEDDDDSEEEEEKPAPKKGKKQPEPEPEEDDDEPEEGDGEEPEETASDDEFESMDRTELKKYIKDNGLDISVKKSWSDDDLREKIREAVNSGDEEEVEEEIEEDEEEEKPAARMTLDDIRKKFNKKK